MYLSFASPPSAVSKPIFPTQYSFCSEFETKRLTHWLVPPKLKNSAKNHAVFWQLIFSTQVLFTQFGRSDCKWCRFIVWSWMCMICIIRFPSWCQVIINCILCILYIPQARFFQNSPVISLNEQDKLGKGCRPWACNLTRSGVRCTI